jgi:DNA ligase-associated metallophosphoesterase
MDAMRFRALSESEGQEALGAGTDRHRRGTIQTHARGEAVELLPHRCVWWPGSATLLVADLHWGKSETFRVAGAPVPGGVLEADLARLDAAVSETGARRVLVLGDLLHAGVGITPGLVEQIRAWRAGPARDVELTVVRGNHDRRIALVAEAWGLTVHQGTLREGPFAFQHEPGEEDGCFTWAGHIHPMAVIRGKTDSLRLPCFWMSPRMGVLPAFSAFTRGLTIRPAVNERLYAMTGQRVVEAE